MHSLILKCRINPNRYHVIEAGGRMLQRGALSNGQKHYFDIAHFLKGFILGI